MRYSLPNECDVDHAASRPLSHRSVRSVEPHPFRGACDRPERDLCRSRLTSLGETIPISRPLSPTSVRPPLQPSATLRTSGAGSDGPTLGTLSSGQAISRIRVVVRALGATFLSAASVRSPLSRPLASWVGKVECRDVRT